MTAFLDEIQQDRQRNPESDDQETPKRSSKRREDVTKLAAELKSAGF
jgi:hypothetical protein